MLTLFRRYKASESPGEDMHTVNIEIPISEHEEPSKRKRMKKAFLNFGKKNPDNN
jgi:hypothetical protein